MIYLYFILKKKVTLPIPPVFSLSKSVFFFFLLLFSNFSYAQYPTLDWVKGFGGSNFDEGYSLAVDDSGNVLTTGIFKGTADFNPNSGVYNLTAMGQADIFVTKIDSAGNFKWAYRMGCNNYNQQGTVATDQQGNVYVCGSFDGTATIGPYTMPAYTMNSFVCKLGPQGNFLWAKQFGAGDNTGVAVAVDLSNNVYVIGTFSGTVDFNPGSGVFNLTQTGYGWNSFICKLNSQGNFVWAKQFVSQTHSTNDIRSIAIGPGNNVLTSGLFQDTVDFNPGSGTFNLISNGVPSSSDNWDVFISKLDSAGNFVWAKQLGGQEREQNGAITVDDSGNVYSTGQFEGTVDFNPGNSTFNLTSAGQWDVYVSKLDSAGNFVWAKKMGGSSYDMGTGIAVDKEQQVYITGWFQMTGDYDPGPGVQNLSTTIGQDIFLCKLKKQGNLDWVYQIGADTSTEIARNIQLDNWGGIYLSGSFAKTVNFNPNGNATNLTSAGYSDAFVLKLFQDPCSSFSVSASANSPLCTGDTIKLMALSQAGTITWTGPNGFNSALQNPTIPNATVNNSGIYKVSVKNNAGCQDTANVVVTVNPVYNDTLSANICQGEYYTIGSNKYSADGIYSDTFSTIGGCDSIITVKLTVHSRPNVQIVQQDQTGDYCIGEKITLTGRGALHYLWFAADGRKYEKEEQALVTLSKAVNVFTLIGFNEWNCSDTAKVQIKAQNCCQLFIPNSFSPNGDGLNDVFEIKGLQTPLHFKLQIFNRYGQLIFLGHSLNDSWNGTFNGGLCDLGVYFYRVSGTCIDGSSINKKGSLTLIR